MNQSQIPVTVVVAAWPDATGLAECLASIERQWDDQMQIIVAANFPPPANFGQDLSAMQWLRTEPGALVPHLWSGGMAAATGDVVALTTAHFLPAADWISQIRAAFGRLDVDGIGGPIDPPRGGGAVAWATYFLRYSIQFNQQREQYVDDIAGDNAAYRRAALARHPDSMRDGFWEPEFHRRVIAESRRLAFVPTMRLTLHSSLGVHRFCSQRFAHGRQFGRDRVAGKPALVRAARIVTAPLIPFVLLVKILTRLRHRPAYVLPFLAALPVLLLFIGAWALGEVRGYLNGASKNESVASASGRLSA